MCINLRNQQFDRQSHRQTDGDGIVFTFRFITANTIPAILGRYPLLRFFCRLKTVPLERDNGTFNSSNTDVVEKVNFVVAA